MAWANNGGPAFESWQIVDPSATPGSVAATLAGDVATSGGTFGQLVLQQDWDYFPHVGTQALQGGFYYKVEAMQGQNHTFYVGGTLSFETVEHSARYAQALVKGHFLPAFLP